jgi:hypothetical protein
MIDFIKCGKCYGVFISDEFESHNCPKESDVMIYPSPAFTPTREDLQIPIKFKNYDKEP